MKNYKRKIEKFYARASKFDNLQQIIDIEANHLLVIDKLLAKGVKFVSVLGVIIDENAKIGKGTIIYGGTILEKGVIIGQKCTIGPNSFISNSKIGDNTIINNSQIRDSIIDNDVTMGPYVQIRPKSHIKDNAHIGDFVEIKNSTIGKNTSVAHLSYIGDSVFGDNVNVGSGCTTVNFDGKNKNNCIVKDNAFIGCHTSLIAPVTIFEGAYIAANSTITKDVPPNALSIGRVEQTIKENWAKSKYK